MRPCANVHQCFPRPIGMAVKFGAHGFLRRDIQSPRLTWLFAGPKRPRLETVLFKGAQPWQCWGPATFSKLEGKLLLGTSNKAWPVSCQLCLASPSWMMMGLFGLKHHFSPSRLTNLAKNHRGCTPLMSLGRPDTKSLEETFKN